MKNRLSIIAIVLWLATLAGAAVLFVRGRTAPAPDGRTAILLPRADRDLVLAEMRNLLEAVQKVTMAIAAADRAEIAAAARTGGLGAAKGVPLDLMARLPLGFKQAGMAMHGGFDEIATAADHGESFKDLNSRLGDQIGLCVGCHQTYRIDPAP